jgi:membrane protein
MSSLFGLLYWGVPNKPVKGWHAGFGGIMAALGFVGLQKLFTLYITTGFNVNMVVYGAFSAIPVFLVWLYASWSVILIGALLVAELPKSASA